MKQTAVEWLNQRRIKNGFNTMEDFQQAKKMEKQQIIDAISESNKSNNRNVSLNPKQYIKETYGGNNAE
jgi:hypothetical protein